VPALIINESLAKVVKSMNQVQTLSNLTVCGDKWTSTCFGSRNISVRGRSYWPSFRI